MLTFEEILLSTQTSGLIVGIDKAHEYLEKRGISKEYFEALQIQFLPAKELVNLVRRNNSSTDERIAIVFPHFDLQSSRIGWWSARLVDTGIAPPIRSFAEQIDRAGRGKMFCPPQEPPRGYLSPLTDWSKLKKGDKIYINESCIKAFNCTKLGYYAVGLNGVWGWKSKKHEIRLIDELKSLPWKQLQLKPVIVFDSNAADNWDVQNAIMALSNTLYDIAQVQTRHILLPPSPEGQHWGFDDFCVAMGEDAAHKYLQGEGDEVPVSEVEVKKFQLNAEVCVVRSLGRIAEQATGTLMTKATFTEVNYGHYIVRSDDEEGRPINVPKLWLADERRSEVQSLSYLPGRPKIHDGVLNLWRDVGEEPMAGDVSPWFDLLNNCVQDETLRKWMIQWFAYPLQHLGGKMATFLHLFGPPGSGKNALLYPILKVYGTNAVTVGRERIASDFNSIYAMRQFINIDELHGGNDRDAQVITNKLKMLVTSPTLVVNQKGQPEYEVKNSVNVVTTSNYLDSIKLDDDDRRAAVIRYEPRVSHKGDSEYWMSYFRWADNGGAGALRYHLLTVDLSDFDPNGWAPWTREKGVVTESTKKHDEVWCRELMEDPDGVLPPPMAGLCFATSDQLATVCYAGDLVGASTGRLISFGKRMFEAGFHRVEVKYNGKKMRLWHIRDRDRTWANSEVTEHLRKHNIT